MDQTRLFTPDECRQVRKSVAIIGLKALQLLKAELEEDKRHGVSETWTKKYKTLADQLRRDYRLDGDDGALPGEVATAEKPGDPLGQLRLVAEDEEVA